jgi:hypothetical protein
VNGKKRDKKRGLFSVPRAKSPIITALSHLFFPNKKKVIIENMG